MKCDASNGYFGWSVIDKATGVRIDRVIWIDPELKTYCTTDKPFRSSPARCTSAPRSRWT
jgi:hypothetical protein